MLQELRKMPNHFEGENRTKSTKVVLWGHNSVLGDAVETFLATRREWEVIKIVDDALDQYLIEQVELVQPNVVIVYETDRANVGSCLCQLLQACPEIKVITLSLSDNYLEVYEKHRIRVNSVSDLLSAIEE